MGFFSVAAAAAVTAVVRAASAGAAAGAGIRAADAFAAALFGLDDVPSGGADDTGNDGNDNNVSHNPVICG
jgi:hypothetical protein